MRKREKFELSFEDLKSFCESEDFKGWDPYDGLSSRLFQSLPLIKHSRFFRLAWIQTFKRLPFNLRKLVKVDKEHNPKGLALFLIGYCNLYKNNKSENYLQKIKELSALILKKQSTGYESSCWGYNFDWQARAFYQPKYTPTVVATSFVTEALVEAYEITGDEKLLIVIKNVEKFVTEKLNKSYDEDGNFTLSYSPLDNTQVYNAGLLGAKTLCLIYKYTRDKKLVEFSKKIVAYVCGKQQKSGAWAYSELPYHQWVDSFHTGYNLECINAYQEITGDRDFESHIRIGFNYYLENFFTPEGVPKYYNNAVYPIDVHAPAQFIVTLCKMERFAENKNLADSVLNWSVDNLQDTAGYFYYQKKKYATSRIPYMRWGQAWMFYAFSNYFLKDTNVESHEEY